MREVLPFPERLDEAGVDLVARCLACSPSSRPSAQEALSHAYFAGFDPESIGTRAAASIF